MHFIEQLNPSFQVFDRLHLGFCALGIFPEGRILRDPFLFFQLQGFSIDVKGTPSAPTGAPTHHVVGLLLSWLILFESVCEGSLSLKKYTFVTVKNIR
jgi:hypothetical protein